MRCKTSERFLSDRLGGTLSLARSRRLDGHLAGCPACRAALGRQERLQAAARAAAPPDPGAAYWENSIARLRAKLEALPAPAPAPDAAKPRRAASFLFGPRWAWAGAASMLAAAAGLYLFVFRAGLPAEMAQAAFDDSYGSIAERIGEDADLQRDLETTLQSALGEHAAGVDSEVHHLFYRPADFLESLSDDEVLALDTAIGKILSI